MKPPIHPVPGGGRRTALLAGLLALLLVTGCRDERPGPLLESYDVTDTDGAAIGQVRLHQVPGSPGAIQEIAAIELPNDRRLRIESRLEAAPGGIRYQATRQVGRLQDTVTVQPTATGTEWKRKQGLTIERKPVEGPVRYLLEASELTDPGPAGSIAAWGLLLQGLSVEQDQPIEVRVFNPRVARFQILRLEPRERATLRLAGEPVPAVRLFASTPGGGLTLWLERDRNRLLAIDGLFGGRGGTLRATLPGLELPVPPEPELPADLAAEEVAVERPGVRLAGTLTRPRASHGQPLPAVILVHGSGPIDRNGEAPGLRIGIFRALAWELSQAGFAVLRYDKRGVGESRFQESEKQATLEDLVGDVTRWVEYLSSRSDVREGGIFLVGHSEGGYIVPIVAARDERVHGIVTLAGPASPAEQALRLQARLIAEAHGFPAEEVARVLKEQDILLKLIKSGRERELAVAGLMNPGTAWLRSHMAHDPARYLQRLEVPILAVFGETDLQVPPSESDVMRAALRSAPTSDVTIVIIPGVDHLFMPRTGPPGLGGYADPDRAVSPLLVNWLVDWLRGRAQG